MSVSARSWSGRMVAEIATTSDEQSRPLNLAATEPKGASVQGLLPLAEHRASHGPAGGAYGIFRRPGVTTRPTCDCRSDRRLVR